MCNMKDCPVHYFPHGTWNEPRKEVGPEPEQAIVSTEVGKTFWEMVEQFVCGTLPYFSLNCSKYLAAN